MRSTHHAAGSATLSGWLHWYLLNSTLCAAPFLRSYPIEELAAEGDFIDSTFLLLHGELPSKQVCAGGWGWGFTLSCAGWDVLGTHRHVQPCAVSCTCGPCCDPLNPGTGSPPCTVCVRVTFLTPAGEGSV